MKAEILVSACGGNNARASLVGHDKPIWAGRPPLDDDIAIGGGDDDDDCDGVAAPLTAGEYDSASEGWLVSLSSLTSSRLIFRRLASRAAPLPGFDWACISVTLDEEGSDLMSDCGRGATSRAA